MKTLGTPPFICLITSGEANSQNYVSESRKILDNVRSAIADGVSMVQVREKELPARSVFELVRDVVDIARDSETLVVVNDRPDIALAAAADGVHLPESSIRPRVVREAFLNRLIIGSSVHSLGAARRAAADGADYIVFAPVFETPGKGEPAGLDRLRDVCHAVPKTPVIALGGIDENSAGRVIDVGAAGVAAIRSLNDASTRRQIIAALR